jgi:hypothetical protein
MICILKCQSISWNSVAIYKLKLIVNMHVKFDYEYIRIRVKLYVEIDDIYMYIEV